MIGERETVRFHMEYLVEHLGVDYYTKDSFEGKPEEAFNRAKEIAIATNQQVRIVNKPLNIDQMVGPE